MTNGRIDAAQVDALLSGGRREIDRYLLVAVIETRDAVEAMPDLIQQTVASEISRCRAERERITAAAVEHAERARAVESADERRRALIAWVLGTIGGLLVIVNTILGLLALR